MGWVDDMLSGIPANAVLRERLLLAQEQRVASAAEAAALRQEYEALRTENQNLKMHNQQLQEQVRRLESNATNHVQRLDAAKEKLLTLLAAQDRTDEQSLVSASGLSQQLAKFHLQDMQVAKLVGNTLRMVPAWGGSAPTSWHLTQEGRRYLVSHGLLT